MSKNNKKNHKRQNLTKEQEAYQTLRAWVETVPDTLRQLEEQGNERQLMNYKKQIKLVLQKLEQIKYDLENEG